MAGEWKVYKKYTSNGEFYNVGRPKQGNEHEIEYCMVWDMERRNAEYVRRVKNKEEKNE